MKFWLIFKNMETKHTPGPWVVRKERELNEYDVQEIYIDTVNGPTSIASVWNPDRENEESESEYDAKLIAAAPDLLAALQRFIKFVDAQKLEYESSMIRQAKKAIKKATT